MYYKLISYFKNITLDLKSVVITLIVIPLILVIRRLVIKYVKEWGEYVVDGLMYFLSRSIKQSVASSLSLRRYCKLQLANEKIKFLNIPSSRDLSVDIDKIFVSLTISYNDEGENEFSHKDFLNIGNRIKVMGDPGSGKSSLIKRVLRNNCQLGLKKTRKAKLPILVELKNLNPPTKNKDLGKWLFEYIKTETAKHKVYKIEDCFDNYALNKGLLILLDGLDEVSSANYLRVAESINGLSSYLSELGENNTIVLTMRTQFYQQVKSDFVTNFPHNTFLKAFSPSDIYEFLSRWNFERDQERNISRVYSDLTDKPTLREMCSNPLILSMYVAEDQISKGNVSPESRTQFYKKITEELIIKRRLMQKSNIPGSYTSLKEQRERILGRIAFDHLTNIEESSNSLKYKNAIRTIRDILSCDNTKAEAVFDEISKETGLITEERHRETFRFIHLTFCEFLAAFEASQGIALGWEQLLKYHRTFLKSFEAKSRLIEVIPFTAGLLPRIQREKSLFDIAKLNDSTLMSRCFLETKLYTHKTWSSFIESSKKNLLTGRQSNFDEKWLQDLHVFNVVVRDANLSAESLNVVEAIDLSGFYENLLENEKISLTQIFSSYASQDAAAVFRLAEVSNIDLRKDFPTLIIQNADQIPFLALLKERLLASKNEEVDEWAALLAEAALEKKLVSVTLNAMEPDGNLEARINKGKYRIWYFRDIVHKTFLTQCITLASTCQNEIRHLRGLNLLMKLKAPTEIKLRIFLRRYVSLLSFIVVIIVVLILFEPFAFKIKFKRHPSVWQFLILSISYFGGFFISHYSIVKKLQYRKAINLYHNLEGNTVLHKMVKFISISRAFEFTSKKDKNILKQLNKLRGE